MDYTRKEGNAVLDHERRKRPASTKFDTGCHRFPNNRADTVPTPSVFGVVGSIAHTRQLDRNPQMTLPEEHPYRHVMPTI